MTSTEPAVLTFEDVQRAAARIAGAVHKTPVLTSRLLDELSGARVFLKCENLQRGGSFKIRGATNRLRSLTNEERRRGVVAFSSGNHAQAVALASNALGVEAVIVMPTDAPRSKIEATRAYGASISFYDRLAEDREAVARELVERDGRVLVPPYDHSQIIAGQGTAALELLTEVPDLDVVVAPVGGGGLLAGTSLVARAQKRTVRVFGAEPETANDTALSLAAGERVTIAPPQTIADGARPQAPGLLTFPLVRDNVDGVLLVRDSDLVAAMELMLTRMKLLAEPTGVLGLAAVLRGLVSNSRERVGVIISGGNIDLQTLAELLQSTL